MKKILATVLVFSFILSLLAILILLSVSYTGTGSIVRGEEYVMTVRPFQTSSRYDLGIDAENVRIGGRSNLAAAIFTRAHTASFLLKRRTAVPPGTAAG